MVARVALTLILIATIVAIGCASGGTGGTPKPEPNGGGNTNGTGVVSPTWIDAQVEGNVVSISTGEVDSGKMLHFRVTEQGASMAFMAYGLDGERYVRANICPPCRSEGFSLAGDILDCNNCHTKFEASTGEGISGACKNYPKAEVAYAIAGDKVTMDIDDLVNAYRNTEKAGLP
jgi:nitrite reductase/ring-hydroxylating ferredoxin subunit